MRNSPNLRGPIFADEDSWTIHDMGQVAARLGFTDGELGTVEHQEHRAGYAGVRGRAAGKWRKSLLSEPRNIWNTRNTQKCGVAESVSA